MQKQQILKEYNHKIKRVIISPEEIAQKIANGEPYVIRQNIPESGVGTYNDLVYGEISVDYKDIEDGYNMNDYRSKLALDSQAYKIAQFIGLRKLFIKFFAFCGTF